MLACVNETFPEADAEALATAGWSLVHGLAFLHLDGKLPSANAEEVDARVVSAVTAILTLQSKQERVHAAHPSRPYGESRIAGRRQA